MATARWVFFDPDATTSFTTATSGTYGYVEGASIASPTATITAGVSDQLQIQVDGGGFNQITLTSGVDLDMRMICREIEFKGKQLAASEFEEFSCEYINNKVRINSGSLGTGSTVSVTNGGNDCLHLLGMAASQGGPLTVNTVNGQASSNNASYTGTPTISGEYKGQFADIYTVMVGTQHPVGSATVTGTYTGSVTTNGDWNEAVNELYTITIDTTNGAVLNAGSGNVPTFTVTSTQGDNIATPVEILYSDYYYQIGTKGLRVKFSDAPFGNGDTVSVQCTAIQFAQGSNAAANVGSAQYVVSARRANKVTTPVTSQTTGTSIGNQGLTIAFSSSGQLTARDEFRVIASGPQPSVLGGTVVNFGSVTITTYSPAAAVWFQLLEGATTLSNTRFGLQSHGTAAHHFNGNNDTLFAFGTAGEATPASDGTQWASEIDPSIDLASDIPPAYLSATEDNLAEVSTASASEPVGVVDGEMITDFIWLAIKIGSSENGANSTINYRMYYDFS